MFLAVLPSEAANARAVDAIEAATAAWKLTPKQREVLDVVSRGLTNVDTGRLLGTTEGTVEYHLARIFDKAGVADALATGDVNNDGHVDIVIADIDYKRVVVLLGDGQGGFSQPTGLVTLTGTNPWSAALGDFDHDGKLDLVLGHRDDRQVLLYVGTGDGHFQTGEPKAIPIPKAAVSMTAGDIDGDGYDDSVATSADKGLTLVFGPCP